MIEERKPLISVIVPAFNAEKTIENCIKSIINQTYGNIEIVMVDDGSNDRTYCVAGRLMEGDERIRIVRQKNKGASIARNRGVREARGDFIIFVDADDVAMPDMADTLFAAQREYGADLVQGAIICIKKGREQMLSDSKMHRYGNGEDIRKHFFEILNNSLNNPVGKLYKKEIIVKHNILFDELLEVSEDLCFNLCYLEEIERMVYIPKPLYRYNADNSFLTKKYKGNLFDMRKRAIEFLDGFLIRNELNRNITHYLYIKLLFASAMQEVEHNKSRKERYKEIESNLNRTEIQKAVECGYPQGNMEKMLHCVVKTKSRMLIDFVSHIMIFARKKRLLTNRRISV